MHSKTAAAIGLAVSLAGGAAAARLPLGDVVSPVYEAPGDAAELARRGKSCMAQILKPGVINAPTIISADIATGMVVANNAFDYSDHAKFMPLVLHARSIATLEAREGRFRMAFTDVQFFYEPGREWRPAVLLSKSDPASDPGRLRLLEISDTIAACIRSGPTPAADW